MEWVIISLYNRAIGDTPDQAVYSRGVIFNLMSVIYGKVIITRNQ